LTNPVINWGDPDKLSRFVWAFFRLGYPGGELSRSWDLFVRQLETINLIDEFGLPLVVIAATGLIRGLKKGRLFTMITVIFFLILSVGVVIYGNPTGKNVFLLKAFHTPTYLVFSLWIGVGITWFLLTAGGLLRSSVKNEKTASYLSAGLILITLTAMPALMFGSNYRKNDRSRNFIAFDYAMNELKSVSEDGILFTWGDSGAFPLWYLHYIEGYRPDVLLLHTPHLGAGWYVESIPELEGSMIGDIPEDHLSPDTLIKIIAGANAGKRKSYIDYSSRYSFPTGGMTFRPHGLLYAYDEGKKEAVDLSVWSAFTTRGIHGGNIVRDLDTNKAIAIYGLTHYDNGYALLGEGRRGEAVSEFVKAVRILPSLSGRVRRVLSLNK